ncbi:hypothetical protein RJ640_013110 [Escallonia rubra]|uniref:Ty3 transposon capsid-like protein domain-containing protein n=1 Tax=Escallonia rubra TaxID=112253 RepID=A0AA88QG93_9ASTE|nr:hypothetical protein RJ640_013110 [Escallonia rubra]
MPRSVKNNQSNEANIHEALEAIVHRLATYNIRMSSIEASIGDLQRSGSAVYQSVSELKFELANLIAEIKAKEGTNSRSTTEKGESSNKNQGIEYVHKQSVNTSPIITPSPVGNPLTKFPQLIFPRFNGENRRGWVRKSEQYFEFCPIHEDYKVSYTSVHFDEQAECWYTSYIKPLGRVSWDQFVVDLYARFSLTNGVNVIGEFNKLVQTGSMDEYFNRFESMRAQVLQEFDYLDENYLCVSFIGGLKPEIRSRVEQVEVESLSKAIYIARREEVAIHSLFKTHRPMPSSIIPLKSSSNTTLNLSFLKPSPLQAIPFRSSINTNPVNPHKGVLPTPPPLKPPPRTNQLSNEEHQRRITLGLYFRCEANFEPGHKSVCPMKSIAMIIAEDEDEIDSPVKPLTLQPKKQYLHYSQILS